MLVNQKNARDTHNITYSSDRMGFVFGVSIAAVFLMFFMVVHVVSAADDNANAPTCSAVLGDCDNTQTECTNQSFDWTSLGYPGGAGNASCCGDDSLEYVQSPVVDPKLQQSSGGPLCWNVSGTMFNTCFWQGQSYSAGAADGFTSYDLFGSSGKDAVCQDGSEIAQPAIWYDCDGSASAGVSETSNKWYCEDGVVGIGTGCGFKWLPGGESSAFGEYITGSETSCCGDDSGEGTLSCQSYYGGVQELCTGAGGSVCCYVDPIDGADSCVFNGTCYAAGSELDVGDSNTDNEVCSGSGVFGQGTDAVWVDQDEDQSYCKAPAPVWGGVAWLSDLAGECFGAGIDNFCGDTETEAEDVACCGDDTNENYIERDCNSNTFESFKTDTGVLVASTGVCCPNDKPNFIIDSFGVGNCVATCDTSPPTVAFNPTSQSWTNQSVSPQVTISDATGVQYGRHCWTTSSSCDPQAVDANNSPFACDGSTPCTASPSQSNNGQWRLCVRAKDTLGYWNDVPTVSNNLCGGPYKIDKTYPTINSLTIYDTVDLVEKDLTQDPVKNTTGNVSITWTASDSGGSGLASVEIWRTVDDGLGAPDDTLWELAGTETVNPSGATFIDNPTDGILPTEEGIYWYGIHVKDSAGNCLTEDAKECGTANTVSGRTVRGPIESIVDGTAPSINFNPTSRPWSSNDISVTLNVSDNVSGISDPSLEYCWTTSSSCAPGIPYTDGEIVTQSSDESWRICAVARDLNTNSRSACQAFYDKDAQAPTVDSISITNFAIGNIVNSPGEPNEQWTVSDQTAPTLSGIDFVQVWRKPGTCAAGGTWADVSGNISQTGDSGVTGNWSDTTLTTGTDDGDYCYGLHVDDIAGNYATESAVQRLDVHVDTEAPNANFSSSSPRGVWVKGTVTVTVSVDDNNTVNNGVNATNYCWHNADTGGTDCDPGTVAGGVNSFTNNSGLSQSNTGTWYLCIRSRDGALNWNAAPTVANGLCDGPYQIDNDPPTTTGVSSDTSQCEKVIWTVNGASDVHSGLHSSNRYSFDNGITWQFSQSKEIPVQGGGIDTRTIKVQDAAGESQGTLGNIWSSGPVSATAVSCDQTPPDISFSPPSRIWSKDSAIVTVTSDDTNTGANNTRYLRRCTIEVGTGSTCGPGTTAANEPATIACDGTTQTCSHQETFASNGRWYMCARARDNTTPGNWSADECGGPYEVDKTAPGANFNTDNTTCEQIVWSIDNISESLSGLPALPCSFDGGTSWQALSVSSPPSCSKTESVPGGGDVARTLIVKDSAGNQNSSGPLTVTSTSCNQAPTITADSQSPGVEGSLTTNNKPSFNLTVSDPNGGDKVGYKIQISTDSGFSNKVIDFEWDGIAIWASRTDTFTVPNSCSPSSGSDWRYFTCTTPLADGTYYWRVQAYDDGNPVMQSSFDEFGLSGIADFTVDTQAPNQPTCTPPGGNYTSGQSVALASIGSDYIKYTKDQTAPANCQSGNTYVNPINISASASIKAIGCDNAGNTSPVEQCDYNIGSVPNTLLDDPGLDPTASADAAFTFSGTNSPDGYRCRLDLSANQGTSWADCTSPKTYTGLNQGRRRFEVKAYSNVFGEDPSPAQYDWQIDLTHPDIDENAVNQGFEVDGQHLPDSPFTTANTSPTVKWNVLDSGGAGLWKIEIWRYTGTCAQADAQSWSGAFIQEDIIDPPPYPGPTAHTGSLNQTLSDGTYCYGLHVVDHVNRCLTERGKDCATATAIPNRPIVGPIEVTVDTTLAPNDPTNLAQSPGIEGALTNDNTPSFDFKISDPNSGDIVGYQIVIDNSSDFSSPAIDYTWDGTANNPNNVTYQVPDTCPGSGYAACTAPLPDDTYYWRVRAKDQTPEFSNWVEFQGPGADFTVDTAGPPKPTCSPGTLNGEYSFIGTLKVDCVDSEANTIIEYSTDGETTWTQYSGTLTFGSSVRLYVRAKDMAGNYSLTPNNWYDYTAGNLPNTAIDPPKPIDPTNNTNATLYYSGNNNPTSFMCQLDPDFLGYTDCTPSPKNYTGLTQGYKTFSVYAVNAYGDDSATPATHSWLIDLTDPALNGSVASPTFKVAGKTVNQAPFTTNDTTPMIEWSVIDGGGSGLYQVEIWRFAGTCAAAAAAVPPWNVANIEYITVGVSYPGPGSYIGNATQGPLADGTYCYGLHVTDHATNWTDESVDGQGPIEVIISAAASPYFTVTAQPPKIQTVAPGGSAQYTVNVDSFNNYSGTVSFSAQWSPSKPTGASEIFNPSSCAFLSSSASRCTTIVTISTTSATPVGSYSIRIDGNDGIDTDSDTVTLDVSTTNQIPNVPKLCGPDELSVCDTY